MKKTETPAQPKVADGGFPPPLKTAALRFPYARQNSVCTRTHGSVTEADYSLDEGARLRAHARKRRV